MESQASLPDCPICLDSLSTDGSHCMVSLPCGHIHGESCLRDSFIKIGNFCPICRNRATIEDIRKIHWDLSVPLDNEQSDLAEQKHSDSLKTIKKLKERVGQLETDIHRSRGRYMFQMTEHKNSTKVKVEKKYKNVMHPSLILEKKIDNGFRLSVTSKHLFLTARNKESHGIIYFELSNLSKFSYIPLHNSQVQAIEVSPYDPQTISSVSADKNLIMTAIRSEQKIFQASLPAPLWSCAWINSNSLAVGGTQGQFFLVDGRGQIISESVLAKGPPVFSVCALSDLLLVSSPICTKLFDIRMMNYLPEIYEGSQATSCCKSNHFVQIGRNAENMFHCRFGKLTDNKKLTYKRIFPIKKSISRARPTVYDDQNSQFLAIPNEEDHTFEIYNSKNLGTNLAQNLENSFVSFAHPSPILDIGIVRSFDLYVASVSSTMFQLYAMPF
ncbi:E3 ubiquitin-protein ligase RFWD3 [Histomonas meleagridis]|uniref:E3 ubiquitin-protein ligase RFWD3 n=1 Tax=Histomonas meleagridis TaxID=135588 RepID=UPI00355A6DEE|nr:E3 ubiquitin-protein ligase RFWD3 [Histomonas meleagridis]KAH0802933.1 E3 ubiquitin-protein ligase RFWD3 [Histomonas meleagridis]